MRGAAGECRHKGQIRHRFRRSNRGYGGVGATFVVPTVATSIDLVVQLGIDPNGHRRVREIVALPGRVESGVIEIADIFTSHGDELVRAQGYPPHADRFHRHGIDLPALLSGGRHDSARD